MNQLCKLPPLLEHISQANRIRNVQHGTRPYVSPTFCFVHFCRCARAQASAIFDVMLRSVVNACDKTANAICFLTVFFLIWESNSDSTKMSYKISMPMFVSVSVQRRYCYLGYTALYQWCVFFIARMLFDHFIGFYALIYICWLFKQNQDRNNIDQPNLLCLVFTRFVRAPHRIYL